MSGYRTIVADPPWAYSTTGWNPGDTHKDQAKRGVGAPRPTGLPYSSMPLSDIAALPVDSLAAANAHLYVWTTQKYLWETREIIETWGFAYNKLLVWCKPPTGFSMGGAYGNACEFVIFARRGKLSTQARIPRDWWEWPRSNQTNGHSAKPEAFLDMVEQVSPGPYLEMFARRARFGWDYWGDQSLGTATVAA